MECRLFLAFGMVNYVVIVVQHSGRFLYQTIQMKYIGGVVGASLILWFN